ncbi:predicted protein [Verticillium alfalfae VaMs.102]|uniref:Predicted protein n=1 Tax=Verticillium alfalfae (strain VaMs.102 / ATCC MYA-4576 / FGSC 10136) TaxID=526221 RepID=C9SVU7_VERA1|nr:predicted protein [Verticillium alfalfae VaMs.102]EEY22912.1 predicted protein [Verticillium alfalfae VaMs.102]
MSSGAIEKNLVSIARCPGPELRVLDRLIARLMVHVEVNVVRSSRPRKVSVSPSSRFGAMLELKARHKLVFLVRHQRDATAASPLQFAMEITCKRSLLPPSAVLPRCLSKSLELLKHFARLGGVRIGRRNSNVETVVRVIEPRIAFVAEVYRVYWSKLRPIH